MRIKIRSNKNKILPTFDTTITVLSKLRAVDSSSKKDEWKVTVIENCFFSKTVIRNVNGNVVSVGGSYICRIPKQYNYLPYNKWKSSKGEYFTISEGDYIVKGRLFDGEDPTPDTIKTIFRNHFPDVFQVKTFKECTELGLAEHYKIEGV